MMLSNYYIIVLGIYFYSLSLGDVRTVYFEAAGLWPKAVKYSVFESILNAVLNLILVIKFGLIGVLLSTIISILVVNFGLRSHLLYKYYFQSYSVRDFFSWHLKYAVVSFLVCGVVFFICNLLTPEYGIGCFLIRAAICAVIPLILFWLIYRNCFERKYIRSGISMILGIVGKIK